MANNADKHWQWVAATVTGTSHQRANLPCQDRLVCREVHGVLAIAVADGAGSAPLAADGATLAVTHLADSLITALLLTLPNHLQTWHSLITQTFADARAAIQQQADQAGRSIREYATTAALLIATDRWTLGAQIGDGALVVQTQADTLLSLCPPQRGEYANTTHFLTQTDALRRLQISLLPQPVKAVAALTDGLLPLALNLAHNQPFAPFFKPLFAFAANSTDPVTAQDELAAFLASPRVNGRTDDDKTLVLARRV